MTTTIPGSLVNKTKKHFLGMTAPAGYVAGVGRGATGFTTRSDIGPARDSTELPMEAAMPAAGPTGPKKRPEDEDDVETEDLNDANYDEFEGYGGSLFAKDPYDKDDEEADEIYRAVDLRQDERRREYREEKYKVAVEQYRRERPKIQQQFSDLKRQLTTLTEEEWAAIPEVGDARNRSKRNPRTEQYTPVPDSLIASAMNIGSINTVMDKSIQSGLSTPYNGFHSTINGMSSSLAGFASTFGSGFTSTLGFGSGLISPGWKTGTKSGSTDLDLRKIGQARNRIMDIRLNQVSDSVSGQTVVDPKGYLTDLQSMVPQNMANVTDIKKARLLFKSIRETNPKLPQAWIASAALEATVGKLEMARILIMEGCGKNSKSEDLWLEAIKLHPPAKAKIIAANAVRDDAVPHSVKVWLKAAELELKLEDKKAVLLKALKRIPHSVRLWKAAIDLENPSDALLLLSKACKECPTSTELWLARAKLETYENAKVVLNEARENIPTERQIWIAAAKLEETDGVNTRVPTMIDRAITVLRGAQVEINRRQWLEDAVEVERTGCPLTAQAIVRSTLGAGIEDEDRKHTWMEDAEWFVGQGAIECARAVYCVAVKAFPGRKGIWTRAAIFEKEYGTTQNYEEVLETAVSECLPATNLWMMLAKSRWLNFCQGNLNSKGASTILSLASQINRGNSDLLMANVKLVVEWLSMKLDSYESLMGRKLDIEQLKWEDDESIEPKQKKMKKEEPEDEEERRRNKVLQLDERWNHLESDENWLATTSKLMVSSRENQAKYLPDMEKRLREMARTLMAMARHWLGRARMLNEFPRGWMKSAKLEWSLGKLDKATELLEQSVRLYPDYEKFYMMLGQIAEQQRRHKDALRCYQQGTIRCPLSIPLWLLLIRFEETFSNLANSRSKLDMAKTKNPKCDLLWLEGIRMEIRAGNKAIAEQQLNRALQECPNSGKLWAEAIFMAQSHQRKSKLFDATKKCEHDPDVLLAAAKVMWAERKIDKARKWFQRTVKVDSDFGDAWAFFYKFELIHGTEKELELVKRHFHNAEPHHGEVWQRVAKDVRNWRLKPDELLEKVVSILEIPK